YNMSAWNSHHHSAQSHYQSKNFQMMHSGWNGWNEIHTKHMLSMSRVTPILSDSFPILFLQVKGQVLSAFLMSTGMRNQLQKGYKPQLDGQKDTLNSHPHQKTQNHLQNLLKLQQSTWENQYHQNPQLNLNSQFNP